MFDVRHGNHTAAYADVQSLVRGVGRLRGVSLRIVDNRPGGKEFAIDIEPNGSIHERFGSRLVVHDLGLLLETPGRPVYAGKNAGSDSVASSNHSLKYAMSARFLPDARVAGFLTEADIGLQSFGNLHGADRPEGDGWVQFEAVGTDNRNGYDLVKSAEGHAYVVVTYADHAKERGMSPLKELIRVNPEYFKERLQNTWAQRSEAQIGAGHSAIGVLAGYPSKKTVSELYDENPDFAEALTTIFGDGFEYPDFSHRTVGTVLKLAKAKLEEKREGTVQHKETDSQKVEIMVAEATGSVLVENKCKAEFSLVSASTEYIDVDAYVKLPELSEFLQRMYVEVNNPKSLIRDVPRFAANETSEFDDGDEVECPPRVMSAFDEAVPQVMALIDEKSQAIRTFDRSRLEAQEIALQAKGSYQEVDPKIDQKLTGPVIGVCDAHIVLSLGRSAAIVAQRDINSIPSRGEPLMLVFKSGKGVVTSQVTEKAKSGPFR